MGILYILLAALLFGSNPSVERTLLSSGLTADLVAFAVVAVSGILAFFAGIIRKESFRLTSSQLAAVVLTGLIGRGLTEVCLIQAYTLVPPGVATMVHFFFPTVVCAASILLFHEKLTWYKAAAVVLSVCGLYGIADGQTALAFDSGDFPRRFQPPRKQLVELQVERVDLAAQRLESVHPRPLPRFCSL